MTHSMEERKECDSMNAQLITMHSLVRYLGLVPYYKLRTLPEFLCTALITEMQMEQQH